MGGDRRRVRAGTAGPAGIQTVPADREPDVARGGRPADAPSVAKPPEKPEKDAGPGDPPAPAGPLGSSVTFAPGVGGAGPRDHSLVESKDEDVTPEDRADEGHFVPPEPELPAADATSKFAWLAVVGGPVLLLVAVLLQWEMTWWLTTLGIGGFLGGFATLVARMSEDDDDEDDPGRGAVV